MNTTGRRLGSLGWPLWGGVLLLSIAGCGSGPDGAAAEVDLSETARRLMDPANVVGALVFGKDGEIAVVDGGGKLVRPCVLPGGAEAAAGAAAADGSKAVEAECGKLAGTTVMNVQSAAFVRHTGSTCLTVGPIVHGGRAYYFQLPAGCKS